MKTSHDSERKLEISPAEQFCQGVLKSVLDELKKEKPETNKLSFECLLFPPDKIDHYRELQTNIAELIPDEYNRPSITLYIKGKNRVEEGDRADFGLIGGIGPLSDANIITSLIALRQGELDNFYVILKSAPPAREKEKKEDASQYAVHSEFHSASIKNFLKENCKYYCLLSNSAHAKSASKVILGLRILGGRLTGNPFFHLVEKIAKNIAHQKPKLVLVVGTQEGFDERLYPTYFDKLKVPSALPDRAEQKLLQEYIERIKAKKEVIIGNKTFVDFLFEQIKKSNTPPSHVLFACTEIPLYLHQETGEKKHLDILNEKLKNNNLGEVRLIDSEECMIQLIVEKQYQLEWEHVKGQSEPQLKLSDGTLCLSANISKLIDYVSETGDQSVINLKDSLAELLKVLAENTVSPDFALQKAKNTLENTIQLYNKNLNFFKKRSPIFKEIKEDLDRLEQCLPQYQKRV